jgi:hypothetical protein
VSKKKKMSEVQTKIFLIDPSKRILSLVLVLNSRGSLTKVTDPKSLSVTSSDGEVPVIVAGEGMKPTDLSSLLDRVGSDGQTFKFLLAVGKSEQLDQPGWKELMDRADGVLILTSSNEELNAEIEKALIGGSKAPTDEAAEALKLLENFGTTGNVLKEEDLQSLLDTLDGSETPGGKSTSSRSKQGVHPSSKPGVKTPSPGSAVDFEVSDKEVLKKRILENPDAFLDFLLQKLDSTQDTFENIKVNSEIVGDIGVETIRERRERLESEISRKESVQSETDEKDKVHEEESRKKPAEEAGKVKGRSLDSPSKPVGEIRKE